MLLLLSNAIATPFSLEVYASSNSTAVPKPPVTEKEAVLTVPSALTITGLPLVIAPDANALYLPFYVGGTVRIFTLSPIT